MKKHTPIPSRFRGPLPCTCALGPHVSGKLRVACVWMQVGSFNEEVRRMVRSRDELDAKDKGKAADAETPKSALEQVPIVHPLLTLTLTLTLTLKPEPDPDP